MEDSTPQEEVKDQRRFKVHLIQTVPEHEVVAETFEYAADNKKLALQEAQNFIDDEKEMDGVTYRLEAEEIKDSEESTTE
ncbi:hypothetical protein HZA56_13950 [Candidatus Poribacteria bacterium]|nr:hypothetical protein [Candidatus Poribacteria bacterium]